MTNDFNKSDEEGQEVRDIFTIAGSFEYLRDAAKFIEENTEIYIDYDLISVNTFPSNRQKTSNLYVDVILTFGLRDGAQTAEVVQRLGEIELELKNIASMLDRLY